MIYICYGVTKSASTFLYQLTEEVLRSDGRTICRIVRPGQSALVNYFDRIDVPFIDRISAKAGSDRCVVLKTHGPLDPGVGDLIASGQVKASASFRDPREIAMSMVDNGLRARQLGERAFSEFHSVTDTISSIEQQLEYLACWANVPGVEVMSYNEVCFATAVAVDRIASQLQVNVDTAHILSKFSRTSLIGEFNVATPLRYKAMTDEDSALIREHFQDFYSKMDLGEAYARSAPLPPKMRKRSGMTHEAKNLIRLVHRLLTTRSIGVIQT